MFQPADDDEDSAMIQSNGAAQIKSPAMKICDRIFQWAAHFPVQRQMHSHDLVVLMDTLMRI